MTVCERSGTSEDVPSLEQQRTLIAEALNAPMNEGETWHLLDCNWLNQWKKFVGFSSSSEDAIGRQEAHPGPIDNSPLLVQEGDELELKQELYCDVDYALVPVEGWGQLVSWYGLAVGQHPITRRVVEHGLYTKDVKVEVYLTSLTVCLNSDPDNTVVTKYSKAALLSDIMADMKQLFGVPAEEDTRLWSRYMNNTYEMMKNLNSTVEHAGLYSGQVLLLEQRCEDGSWPRQTRTRSLSGSTSGASAFLESSTAQPGSSYASYGSYSSEYRATANLAVKSGLCGLSNLGNTCFMNSSVQCLSNTLALTKYFLADSYRAELNHTNPLGTGGRIAKAYADLLKQMWSGQNNYVVPRDFKMQVGRFAPQLSGFQQQDSHELLAFLLDGLHEDLNRVKRKPYIEIADAGNRPDNVVAAEAWRDHLLRNDSIIVDLFHGVFKSTVVCPECDKVSVKFDPFCYLTLPLPSNSERTLKVTFVSLDATKNPVVMKLKCPKNGTIANLCQAVSCVTGLPADKLVVADVFSHRFHKIYSKHKSVSYIEDRDTTYVYEIPISIDDYEDSELLLLPVYHREAKSLAKDAYSYGSSANLFGVPMLVPVPRRNVTYRDLYELLLKRMRRFLLDVPKETSACAGSETAGEITEAELSVLPASAEETNTSIDMDCGDDQTVVAASRDEQTLFAIKSVNSFGNAVLKSFEDGAQPLDLTSQMYLSADWEPSMKELYYNTTAAEDVDSHSSLSLPSNEKQAIQLSECLDLFLSKEKLGADDLWYCPSCKKHQQASKKFDLWSLPKVVVIHLKRFSYSRFLRDKLDSLVEFPIRGLDLSKFVINKDHPPAVYDLQAVSNHYGGLGGGHYTAYSKNAHDGLWYYFDDTSVTRAEENQIVSKAAYLLFYVRREDPTHEAMVANDLLSDDESVLHQTSMTSNDEDDGAFQLQA